MEQGFLNVMCEHESYGCKNWSKNFNWAQLFLKQRFLCHLEKILGFIPSCVAHPADHRTSGLSDPSSSSDSKSWESCLSVGLELRTSVQSPDVQLFQEPLNTVSEQCCTPIMLGSPVCCFSQLLRSVMVEYNHCTVCLQTYPMVELIWVNLISPVQKQTDDYMQEIYRQFVLSMPDATTSTMSFHWDHPSCMGD